MEKVAQHLGPRRQVILGIIALVSAFVQPLMADPIAYEATGSEQFGTIDLTTGQFSQIGNMGVLLSGLGVGPGGAIYGGYYGGNTLYEVNPANGGVTSIGSGLFNYYVFGSTTTGLYGMDSSGNLFSVNSASGQTTLIGSTGLVIGGATGLSSNSGTLYCTNGQD